VFRADDLPAMLRRDICRSIALGALLIPALAWSQAGPDATLSLYGLDLKNADAEAFLAAAVAAGGQRRTQPQGAAPVLDMRGAGVPALQSLTLSVLDGKVARVEFGVKAYGQDNLQLRQLLLDKYGPPMTVGARPLVFGGFAANAAPRGGFQWSFADGMQLVYEHPRIGDVTLSYVDSERAKAAAAADHKPPADVRNRF
jgi:hypothetical protein